VESIYKSYFSDRFHEDTCPKKSVDIKPLLADEMVMICGGFHGIQKFIFERLSTQKASKVLRAKSAFIQIFTIYLAKYICKRLGISEAHILSANAGKFEILAPKVDEARVRDIQSQVDAYFIKHYYGLSGVNIVSIGCTREDFDPQNTKGYRALRELIESAIEDQKFHKLDLVNLKDARLEYDHAIDNATLCRVCNIRKCREEKEVIQEECDICNSFIKLGKKLVLEDNKKVAFAKDFKIDFFDQEYKIELNDKLKSYVLPDSKDSNSPADFSLLAKKAHKGGKGVEAIGVLKADVDNMGAFLLESDVTDNFENFEIFSKSMDRFFSLYIPKIMKEQKAYNNTYTVFAGGDDLFLVGAWDEIVALARKIDEEFNNFIQSDKLSLSFGIAIAKPTHPISYLASHTEHLLERSKFIDEDEQRKPECDELPKAKNAITLFGETLKWECYLETFKKLKEAFENLKEEDTKSAFFYRLLELIEMSKRVKYDNHIPSTMWKSKLVYSFDRNMPKGYEKLLKVLDECIESNPKATKMFISEYIYKRRD